MPNARLRVYKRFFKRVLDIVLGLIALPFVLIVFIVFAPMIYLEDKGPVFYNAPRVGKNGKPFVMYKFRSMYVNAPDLKMEDGSTYNGADDPRMTKIGAFMRKTSLDEFPQFLNVFMGQMSVVGPRPPLPREVEQYTEYDLQRLAVKPGITGWWQVTDRNDTDFDGMVRRDLEYIANRGPITDLKIVLLTVVEVFTGGGAC